MTLVLGLAFFLAVAVFILFDGFEGELDLVVESGKVGFELFEPVFLFPHFFDYFLKDGMSLEICSTSFWYFSRRGGMVSKVRRSIWASVLLERMATYSEKFMPPCSSMLPSSMVRAPIVPFLSWVDEQLLVVKQVEFVAVEGFLDGVGDNIDFVVGKEFGYLVAFSYATAVALLQIFGRPGNVELVDGDAPTLGVDLLQGKGLARVYTEIF